MTLDEISAFQSAVHEVRRRQRLSRLLAGVWLAALIAVGICLAI